MLENKFTVINNEDIQKYFTEKEKLMVEAILYTLHQKKVEAGAQVNQKYIVINQDEPYAQDIISIMKAAGHWDEGDSEEFLSNEDVATVEFRGVSYTFTKLEDKDISDQFNKKPGTLNMTHRIDGFEVPIFIVVDSEIGEFTFAHEAGNGLYVSVQDESIHDLAVDLVVYANENFISEPKPAEEETSNLEPAEQLEELPQEIPQIKELLLLEKNQLLLHKKGNPYKVKSTEVGHSEEPAEPHILYKALYKTDRKVWVRPYKMFTTDRFAPLSFWEYLQFKFGSQVSKDNLILKKFGKLPEE